MPTGPATDLIVGFSESDLLRVSGYVSISIADFLHVSGQFAFSKSGAPLTVKVAGSTTTKQVNVLTIGASDVNAFVGVGGPYFKDSNNDGIIDENDTPQADGAMGFVLRNLDFALALFKPTATTDASSYYAIKASGGAEVVGIDGITIRANVLGVEINGGKTDTQPTTLTSTFVSGALDLANSPSFAANGGLNVQTGSDPDGAGDLPAPSIKLGYTANVIRAFGDVTIIIDNFRYVSGNFEFFKSADPLTVTLSNNTTKTVSVLTVGASNVYAFVGTGDPDSNRDGVFNGNDNPAGNGAIGLAITDLDFGLALFKPVAAADTSSYYALNASAAGISLIGVPGVTLGAGNLKVAVNGSSAPSAGGATPTGPPPVIDFVASFGSSGFSVGTGRTDTRCPRRGTPYGQKFSARIIAASGDVTIGLDFNTDGVAEITLSSFISFEQSFRPNGSQVIKIALTDLSFVLGDPADPVFQLSGLAGYFLITQQGLAARIELPGFGTVINGAGASIAINGDLAVEIKTMDAAVDETFVKNSAGDTLRLVMGQGRYLRLEGSLSLTVTFADASVSAPFVMSGDFAFEQVTLTDPNPGDTVPAPKAIRIGAANVRVEVLGAKLIDGQGGFIFGRTASPGRCA